MRSTAKIEKIDAAAGPVSEVGGFSQVSIVILDESEQIDQRLRAFRRYKSGDSFARSRMSGVETQVEKFGGRLATKRTSQWASG